MRTIQAAAVLAAALAMGIPAAAESLPEVLGKMDQASSTFQSMSASLRWVTHTKVLNEDSEQTGNIWIKRVKRGGLRMRVDISKPDRVFYAFSERKFETYYPNMQTVQEYDLGKYGHLVNQFLLLGFGTPARELTKTYSVRLVSVERVAGQAAARLELIPKSSQAREHLSKAELWISLATGQPVQQKFLQPTGDYKTATYLDVKTEPLPDDVVKLNLPKGVKIKRESPQK
jgi:outer membrane lipoprotein-sorting protein